MSGSPSLSPSAAGMTNNPLLLAAEEPESILTAAQILREGGVVVLPTDTVYGVAASIFQADSIGRVFRVKRRPPEARVPVLLASAADLPIVVEDIPRPAWNLIYRFWPGPLTLVLPSRSSVSSVITARGRTLAVRVPAARSCLEVLQVLGEPVIGTSANVSGAPPALRADDACRQLGEGVDAILVDDDAVRVGTSSTVVEITDGPPLVHRIGAVSVEEVRDAIGVSTQSAGHLTFRREGH